MSTPDVAAPVVAAPVVAAHDEAAHDEATPVVATPVICDGDTLFFFHVSNQPDAYGIFDKIKNGLYTPLSNLLYDIGVTKAIQSSISGIATKENVIGLIFNNVNIGNTDNLEDKIPFLTPRKTNNLILNGKLNASMEQLNKYRYLLNNLYSKDYPFTPLQFACIYNRQDIVMLILQHLIASNPTYIKNYINYVVMFTPTKGIFKGIRLYCRAIDLIDTSYKLFENKGITSTGRQTLNAVGNVAKDVFTGNVYQGTAKAAVKLLKLGKNTINKTAQKATGRNIIEEILLQLGSEGKRNLGSCTDDTIQKPPTVIYNVNRIRYGVKRKGGSHKQTIKNSRVSKNKRKT